ncbi:30S ribosomal protein S20 [Aminiphilus circumscriptus]|uniref:30S ribosomal protein S20 n=1 Tax=Aminiphilus circumscriptus TaxID=290732 RepID=UPI0030843459
MLEWPLLMTKGGDSIAEQEIRRKASAYRRAKPALQPLLDKSFKTAGKRVSRAVQSGNDELAQSRLNEAQSILDKAVVKGVLTRIPLPPQGEPHQARQIPRHGQVNVCCTACGNTNRGRPPRDVLF